MVSLNHMAGGFCSPTYRANLSTSVSSCLGHVHSLMADTRLPRSCGWLSIGLQFCPSEAQDLVGDTAGISFVDHPGTLYVPAEQGCVFKSPRPPRNATPTVLCASQTALSTIFVSEAEKPRKNVIFRTTAEYTCCHLKHGWVAGSLAELLKNTVMEHLPRRPSAVRSFGVSELPH